MNEDRLTYDELLKFNNHTIEDAKEFGKELRNRIDEQRTILISTTGCDNSLYEKVIESAIKEGCGIAIFKPSQEDGIHIEHVPNKGTKRVAASSFGAIMYDIDIHSKLDKKYEEKQAYQEFAINKLIKLPKKKKTFQENFGYVKRKFR